MENKADVVAAMPCVEKIRAIQDALEVLNDKWKIPIIVSLATENKRFKEISNDIPRITDRMLSKELKDLEVNELVSRRVLDTFPPRVEYALTQHGHSLGQLTAELYRWGQLHCGKIMGK